MVDMSLFDTSEITESSNELYAVVGRALTFATHYEMNCRAVVNYINFRLKFINTRDEDEILDFFEKSSKESLFRKIKAFTSTITKGLEKMGETNELIEALFESVFQWLHDGREARNFIAHELTLGLRDRDQDAEFRSRLISNLREQVGKIAQADFQMAGFIDGNINKIGYPTNMGLYIKEVKNWICGEEKGC
jgi:hypothetical protein